MSKFPVNQTLAIETKPLCQHNKIAQNIVTVFYQEKPIRLEEKTHLKKLGVDKRKVVYENQCRNNSNCCWWASDLMKRKLEGDIFRRGSIFSIEEQDKDMRSHAGDGGFADYWGRANALSRHYKNITFMDKFRQGCKRSRNFFNKPKYATDQQQQGRESVTWLMKPITKIRSSHADIRLKGIQNKLKNSIIKCKLKPTKSSRDPLPFRNIITKSYNVDEWLKLHTPCQAQEQETVELESNNATRCQKNEIIETSHQENNDWQQKIIELCQQDPTVTEEKPESPAANSMDINKREEIIETTNSRESIATLVNQPEQNLSIKIEKEDSKDSSTSLEANTAIKEKDLKNLAKLSKKTVNHSKRKKAKTAAKTKKSPKVEKSESVLNVKQETDSCLNKPNIVKAANKSLKQANQTNNNNKCSDKVLQKPAKEEDLNKKNPNKLKNPERTSQTNVKNESLSKNKQNQVKDCDKVTLITVKQKDIKNPKESLKKDKPVNNALQNLEKTLHNGDRKPMEIKPPAEATSKSKKTENATNEINLKCVPADKVTPIVRDTSPTRNLKLKYFKESTNKLSHKSSFELRERNRKKKQLLLKYFKESDFEKPETAKQTVVPSILQQYPKHLLPVVQYNEERKNEKLSRYKTNIERKWNIESVKTPAIIEFFNMPDKNRNPSLCRDFEIQPGNKTPTTIVRKHKILTKSEEITTTSSCYSKTLDKLTNLGKCQPLKLTKSKTGNTAHKIKPQSTQVLNTSKYIAQLMQTVVTKAYESEIKSKRHLRQPNIGNKLIKPNIVVKHQETPKASIT